MQIVQLQREATSVSFVFPGASVPEITVLAPPSALVLDVEPRW